MDSNAIGKNLLRIRRSGEKRITQADVAKKAGISKLAYQKIEKGISLPRVDTLQKISLALNAKIQDLIVSPPFLSAVRFRAAKNLRSRDAILNDVGRWLEDFNELEELVGDRIDYKFKDFSGRQSIRSRESRQAERIASEVRNTFSLKQDEPIRNICGLLESAGIKVFPYDLASTNFFGLSVAQADGGPAIVVNVYPKISVERRIFSAAHELGHLLLHLSSYKVEKSEEDKNEEDEANAFAGHFLMPTPAFEKEWRATYGLDFERRLYKVKRIFRVSYKTVIYRLISTGMKDTRIWEQFSIAYRKKHGSSLGHHNEPEALRADEEQGLLPIDFTEDRLSRLVRMAIENDLISLSRGAEILKLDIVSMRLRASLWV